MKKIAVVLTIAIFLIALLLAQPRTKGSPDSNKADESSKTNGQFLSVAKNLDTPWGLVFLPDKSILVTERIGNLRIVTPNGSIKEKPVFINDKSKDVGEGGVLGITIHPNFQSSKYIYLYYTYSDDNTNTLNRVSRYTYVNEALTDEKTIIDKIPGSANHNGGRIKFGPDNLLYVTTGDAQNPSQSQDRNSLAGKILRVTDEGKIPTENPFGNAVYSYGHRNPQGIAWDSSGKLWETEHGPSGGTLGTGNDEINLIEKGKNYGWPVIQGDQRKSGMVTPVVNSTPSVSWAPAGLAIFNNSLFFGGLRGTALYEYKINENKIIEHFKGKFGRIRDVVLDPDNMLYITTSNRDGRGFPSTGDDQIIKITPTNL